MILAVPRDWEHRPLGKCATFLSGGTPTKSRADFWGGEIPWISAKSLNSFYISSSDLYVTDLGAANGTRLVEKDTILFIVRGMSLKTEFRLGITQLPVTFNQDLKALIPIDGIDPHFLAYAIRAQTKRILGLVDEAGHGTGRLPTALLQELDMPVPPLDEQRRIAGVLGALDDKIELSRKMNRTLEEMAQAIFKSWFIDFDGHTDLVDSELGPIPRGWRVARLGDLATKIGSGATPRGGSKAYVEDGVKFIRSQNVYDFRFSWPGLVCISDEDAERLRGVTVEVGDVLINITGDSILRTCVVDSVVLPARVNQHVAIVRPKGNIPASLVHLHLLHRRMKDWLLGHSAGGTRKAITKGHLEGVPVPLPPADVLRQLRALTDPIYGRIEANWAESRTLKELRDTLLPKLISGEIRVPEAEKLAEAAG